MQHLPDAGDVLRPNGLIQGVLQKGQLPLQLLRGDGGLMLYEDHAVAGLFQVPAGHQQMHVARQTVGQRAEKAGDPVIRQQMKVVKKHIAGHFPAQYVAQVIRQKARSSRVCRTVVIPQEIKPRIGKGILYALPEDGQIVRVDTNPDDAYSFRLRLLPEIPVHRRGLPVAHGGHHGGQRAAGDRPQAFLQTLGYVYGVQVPFPFRHDVHSWAVFYKSGCIFCYCI